VGRFLLILWFSDGLGTSSFAAPGPDSKAGNSQLQSTQFYHLSFYGYPGRVQVLSNWDPKQMLTRKAFQYLFIPQRLRASDPEPTWVKPGFPLRLSERLISLGMLKYILPSSPLLEREDQPRQSARPEESYPLVLEDRFP